MESRNDNTHENEGHENEGRDTGERKPKEGALHRRSFLNGSLAAAVTATYKRPSSPA